MYSFLILQQAVYVTPSEPWTYNKNTTENVVMTEKHWSKDDW